MRKRRVKIRVKTIVPEIVKIIVLETVPLQNEEWWPRKQDNPTLGKICKAYEVRLVFSNGDSVLDRMHYLTSGASRNCFLFDSLRMVCSYEAAGRYTTHEDEARGAPAWRAVLPNHMPEIFFWKQVRAVTNSGRNVVLDCLLTEKRLVPHCKRHFGSSAHCPKNFP